MSDLEQLAELRGLYARACNALAATPINEVQKRRLRELYRVSLAQAIDALQRLEKRNTR